MLDKAFENRLPQKFAEKYKLLMGEESGLLFEALSSDRVHGFRANTLKTTQDGFEAACAKEGITGLEKVPWTVDGYMYDGEDRPGKSILHHCGLCYIQEPSAMLPGAVADTKRGMKVLDLCSAPGGKAVQMAAGMCGEGLLYANDISGSRIKALIKNLETYGVRNAIVLNETPKNLAARFQHYFDVIVTDVPCSGEGMFRKDKSSMKSWSEYGTDGLVGIQADILEQAEKMLAPGGKIIYSTCTYAPEEDEWIIEDFLSKHKGYELENIVKHSGMESGRTNWTKFGTDMSRTARMWPHRLKGEGHFTAAIRSTDFDAETFIPKGGTAKLLLNGEVYELYRQFAEKHLKNVPEGIYFTVGTGLYMLPEAPLSLDRLKVCKFGWYLGNAEHGSFIPSQSFAAALLKDELREEWTVEINEDAAARSYLRCETPNFDLSDKGWYAVTIYGYTAGWVKSTGDTVKNMYPKGWRMQ